MHHSQMFGRSIRRLPRAVSILLSNPRMRGKHGNIGALFISLGGVVHWQAWVLGGLLNVLHWGGLAFVLVGVSYCVHTTRLFGKTEHGKLKLLNKIALLPYLALIWATWHAVRVLQRESAFDKVTPTLWVGRRLLGSEPVPPVEVVLDLTCEFDEPRTIREACSKYVALPILDKGVPCNPDEVLELLRELSAAGTSVYVHCAQGHGRTGMIAGLLLLYQQDELSPAEALAAIQKARPGVALAWEQMKFIERAASLLKVAA